jgi:hypothetical protein
VCRRWQPNAAEGGQALPMAAERRRWRPSSADGGQAPPMAAELRAVDGQAQCRRWLPAQPGQYEIKSNLIKLLQEKCGDEMKCDTKLSRTPRMLIQLPPATTMAVQNMDGW